MKRYEIEVGNNHEREVLCVGRRFKPDSSRTVVVNARQLPKVKAHPALSVEVLKELEPPEPAEVEEEIEEVAIEDLSVDELKAELKEAGLSQAGKKAELVDRLTEYLESENEDEEDDESDEDEDEDA